MLHHDAVYSPTLAQQGLVPGKKKQSQKAVANQAQHLAYLDQHPYDEFDKNDLDEVCVSFSTGLRDMK